MYVNKDEGQAHFNFSVFLRRGNRSILSDNFFSHWNYRKHTLLSGKKAVFNCFTSALFDSQFCRVLIRCLIHVQTKECIHV